MWKDELEKIRSINKEYDIAMNPGCLNDLILKFEKAAGEYLGSDLPDTYKEFLKEVNGLEFNGFIFFGMDDFISELDSEDDIGLIMCNQDLYEELDTMQYLFLVDSDISLYGFDFTNKCYVLLDKSSLEEEARYYSDCEMFEAAFKAALNQEE